MMKNLHVFNTVLFVFLFGIVFSQTTIINPAAEGGFALGSSFSANGWTSSSGSNNPWVVGSAVTTSPFSGNSAYISSTSGSSHAYSTSSACTNYFYRDVTVPAGQSKIILSFNWLCQGEASWDIWQVFVAPTSVVPAGSTTHAGSGTSNIPAGIAGATFIGNGSPQASVQTAILSLPENLAGTTFRLIFAWKSDTGGGVQPPAAIDNISLVSSMPTHIYSAGSGDWTAGATWVGGAAPASVDTVTINSGHTVSINAVNLGAAKMNVSGTLGYGVTPSSFTISRDLNINSGGSVNVFNSTTGKTLVVGGNIVNQGTLNISVGSTSAGNLTLSGTTVQTVSGTGVFTSNLIRNLTLNNTNSATPNVIWNVNNITIANNITFTSARLSLNGNKLLWYNALNTSGSMTVNPGQGILPGGKFARYWTTAQTGTAITAGVEPTSNTSRYPFINAAGLNRSLFITRSSSSATGNTAGVLSVEYTDASTVTSGLSVTDAGYTITDRYNGNWSIAAEGGYVYSSGTHTLTAIASQSLYTSGTNVRLMNASSVAGSHQIGTTTPCAQRTGLSTSQITSSPFYMGINTSDLNMVSLSSGDWNNPAIWSKGVVPSCLDAVVISAGHTVNATSSDVCKSITIVGTYIIGAGDDVTVGCTNNNAIFSIDGGMFEIQSGGNLTVNGKFVLTSNTSGIFIQNGGNIKVDGNNGTLATSATSHLVDLFCHNANTLQLNGGSFTVVDPPISTTTSDCAFKVFPSSTANFVSGSGSSWTLKLGDGVSTTAGGHANGYLINLSNSNSFSINGDVVVDALAGGTNRHVQTTGNAPIRNLTINSGEYRISSANYIKGNIVNNGTLTTTSTLHCSDFAASSAVPGSIMQSISGSGIFRNSTTTTTASLSSLTINNTGGVTLNTPISVSSTLTLLNGKVHTTATNLLTLGTASFNGTFSGTPDDTKFVNGPFARTFSSSSTATNTFTNTHLFPVGANSAYQPVWISPTTTSGGSVTFTAQAYGPPNSGTSAAGVSNLSDDTWILVPNSNANLTNVHFQLGDNSIVTGKQILQAASASGEYAATSAGTIAGTSTTPMSIKSASPLPAAEFTGFFAYGDLVPCVTPTDQPTSFNTPTIGTTFLTGTFSAAESNPTGYLVVRYLSPGTYTDPADKTAYSIGSALGTGTVVAFGPALSFAQTGLTAGTTYEYVIYAFDNNACFGPSYNIANPLIGIVTTCASATGTPGTPTSSMITTNSFNVNWTASSTSGVDYYIDVSTNNTFTAILPDYNNLIVGPNLTTSISGLYSNTTYFVRVKAAIGGCFSANTSSLTVKTECEPFTSFPVTETFANFIINTCWNEGKNGDLANGPLTYSQTSSTSAWAADGFLNAGSTGAASVNIYATGKNDWLISPPYIIPGSDYRATYNVGATQYNTSNPPAAAWETDDFVEVLISDGSYANWNVLKTYNSTNVPSHLGQLDALDLSAYNGQTVRFAFRAVEGASNGSADIDFLIDNFTIEITPIPTIESLGSSSGCPGTPLVINGTNLLGASASNVKIGDVPVASIVSNTGSVLTVILPLSSVSGPVSVMIGSNTATSQESFTILDKPRAELLPVGPTTICSDASVLYSVTTDIADAFVWKRDGMIISGANGTTYTATLAGNYRCIVTVSSTGCKDSTIISNLIVNPVPSNPLAAANSTNVCEGSQLNLTSSATVPLVYVVNPTGSESFIDIDATGASVGTLSDDSEHNFTMPSFTFNGVTYTSGRLGMNGGIALGASSGDITFNNAALPSTGNTAGNVLILPWWDDLDFQSSPATSIKTETVGNKFIIQYTGAVHNLATSSAIKFQVQFDNSNGKIHFVYDDVDLGNTSYNSGASATVGIQTGSTTAYQHSFNTSSLAAGQCITFSPTSTIYSWVGPNGFTSSSQNPSIPSITQAASGNYAVTFTNSATGCTSSASVEISVSQAPIGGVASGPASGETYTAYTYTVTGTTGQLQWQSASSLAGPYTDISGATGDVLDYTPVAGGTLFLRCKAFISSCVAYSNVISVQVSLKGDNVCNALPLSLGANGPYTNAGATGETGEVVPPGSTCRSQTTWCNNTGAKNSVWFTFTPQVSGKYGFMMTNTSFDSQFGLYTAQSCSPFSGFILLAANDDNTTPGSGNWSAIDPVCLTEGTTYYLLVDGSNNVTNNNWGIQVTKSANLPPSFANCPSNITICGSNVVNYTPPTASDDCGTPAVVNNYSPGAAFPSGISTVSYIATDIEGSTAICSFTVNVSPILSSCPSNITVCGTNIANYTPPTSFQYCGPVTITSNYDPGDEFPFGPTQVTYTATNMAGNTETCSFVVTVRELLSPCPQNFTVCGTNTVNYSAPTSHEDCGPVAITSNYDPGDEFPSGVTVVSYMATSQAGHTASCSFEVKVSPEIVVNTNIIQPVCATYVGFVTLQASGGIPPLVYSSSNPPTSNMQPGVYNFLYTDAYGCTETAVVNIIAPPNPCLPPIPACGNIITIYANPGNLGYNGPGTADVYLIPAAALDAGTFSLLPGTLTRQVKRTLTNVAFNWTTNGACLDVTPNSIYNNNDRGLVYRNCLPVTPTDFNQIRNFDMTLTDYFGTSTCSGRYKVVFGYPPTNAEGEEIVEALTRNLNEEFQIFPNPGNNQVYIATSLQEGVVYSLTITDAFGKLVKQIDQVELGLMSIETTDLLPGAYTMMLKGGETLKTLKWLKIE